MNSLDLNSNFESSNLEVLLSYKIVIIGQPAVGKTSLRARYIGNRFREYYNPTLGADYADIYLTIGMHRINATIWDLSGQARFSNIHPKYYVGSHGAIVVYSVEEEDPLEQVIKWIDRYIEYSGNIGGPLLLIQNKIDLLDPIKESKTVIDHEELIRRLNIYYHNKFHIIGHRASAKSGENVKYSINHFVQELLNYQESGENKFATLSNQLRGGLYSKNTYLMFFDEELGPSILSKSPLPKNMSYTSDEISLTVRLYSMLDYEDLIRNGFRIGMSPWSIEDNTIYYVAFVVYNEKQRGNYELFVLGITMSNDLTNLLADSQRRIEGFLVSAMNELQELLSQLKIEGNEENDMLKVRLRREKEPDLEDVLINLRINMDSLVRDLLYKK